MPIFISSLVAVYKTAVLPLSPDALVGTPTSDTSERRGYVPILTQGSNIKTQGQNPITKNYLLFFIVRILAPRMFEISTNSVSNEFISCREASVASRRSSSQYLLSLADFSAIS